MSEQPSRTGDSQIDDQILRGYEGALRDFFGRRVRSRDEVDDLVQEAFARLIASDERREVQYPVAYLFRIASNLLHDRGRRQARTPLHADLEEAESTVGVAPNQEDRRHHDDLRAALDQALAILSPRAREVFVMRRFRNMDTQEIARALHISRRMVQKHLTSAMREICRQLDDGSARREIEQ